MQKNFIAYFFALFLTAIYLAGLSTTANASEEEAANYSNSPPMVTPGTSAPRGNGQGLGRRYQWQTSGPGRGTPDYRDAYSSYPAHNPYNPEALPPGQRSNRAGYGRDGRGFGYGYPGYRGQGGSGYTRHRQYADPPRYPVAAVPGEQAAPQQ